MRSVLICLAFWFSTSTNAQQQAAPTISAKAEEAPVSVKNKFNSQSIGHLVTPNNKVLKPGEISVGTLYAAVGVMGWFDIGFSPFVVSQYEMYNGLARWARPLSKDERIGVDVEYFKSYGKTKTYTQFQGDSVGNLKRVEVEDPSYPIFKMEAWAGKLTYNRMLAPWYRMNTCASYYYYIDDERPFSLRMDPANEDRYAANLTTLHEFRLHKQIYFNYEIGMWGLNYQYPYWHTGATIGVQGDAYLISIGASTTFSPSFPKEKARYFAGYDSRAAVHPELQLQVFF